MVEPERPQITTIWRMRFACWITKATHTVSEYVIKFRPRTGRGPRARGVLKVQLFSCFTLGAKWDWVVNATHPLLYPRERAPYALYRKQGRPQGRSGQMRKMSPLSGIRSTDHPARSEPLGRLGYPGPIMCNAYCFFTTTTVTRTRHNVTLHVRCQSC
jgi:hypothetical protein